MLQAQALAPVCPWNLDIGYAQCTYLCVVIFLKFIFSHRVSFSFYNMLLFFSSHQQNLFSHWWSCLSLGKTQVFVILLSFCDLVHAQIIVDLFAKQLNNALNVPKITNRRAKSQKYGR